jgi:multidrug efflux pump subunit AcrA (membrane-fusion protein)
MKRKTVFIPLLILVTGILLMYILLSFRTEPPKNAHPPRAKIVEAEVIEMGNVPTNITAYGRLTSVQPVTLFSEVSGTLMKGSTPFLPGQSFNEGDLLVRIDDRQISLDLNSTKSDFLASLAAVLPEIKVDFPQEFKIWQDYFNNCSFDQRLAILPEASNQQIKLFLSRFNVYKLYFAARNLEILLDKHNFYAPFDGSVVSTDVRVGSNVRNGTALGRIINLENMEVEVPLPVQDIEWINYEKPVVFSSAEISGEWQGKIMRTGRSIDDRTQAIPLFISVDYHEDNRLYDGIFLKALIPGLTVENAVSISRKSLYKEKYVYIVVNGKLEYRELDIARREADSAIATGGISSGDTLIVEILQGVSPGMLATPRLKDTTGKN